MPALTRQEHLRKTAKQLDKAQQRLTGGRSGDYLNFREVGRVEMRFWACA